MSARSCVPDEISDTESDTDSVLFAAPKNLQLTKKLMKKLESGA